MRGLYFGNRPIVEDALEGGLSFYFRVPNQASGRGVPHPSRGLFLTPPSPVPSPARDGGVGGMSLDRGGTSYMQRTDEP